MLNIWFYPYTINTKFILLKYYFLNNQHLIKSKAYKR